MARKNQCYKPRWILRYPMKKNVIKLIIKRVRFLKWKEIENVKRARIVIDFFNCYKLNNLMNNQQTCKSKVNFSLVCNNHKKVLFSLKLLGKLHRHMN
jgi:hypothetical protein